MKFSAGDDLVLLIRSMDKTERRYFKLYSGAHQGRESTSYLRLFDHLQEADKWDESELERVFPNAGFLRQLNVARTALQVQIIDTLRAYRQGKTFQLDFSRRLDEIELLMQRKLYSAAGRAIGSARRRAAKLELPVQEFEIIKWEMRLERQLPSKDKQESLHQLHARQLELLQCLERETLLLHGVDEMVALLTEKNLADSDRRARMMQICNDARLPADDRVLLFDSKILFHYMMAYRGIALDHPEGYFDHHEAMIDIWETFPDRIRLEEDRYYKLLAGHAESCIEAKRYASIPKALGKLQRLMLRTAVLDASESARILHIELRYLFETKQWDLAFGVQMSVASLLDQHFESVALPLKTGLISNSLLVCFMCEQWRLVIHWGRRLPADVFHIADGSIPHLIYITRWLAWYQLGDLDAIERELSHPSTRQIRLELPEMILQLKLLLAAVSEAAEQAALQILLSQSISPPASKLLDQLLKTWARGILFSKRLTTIDVEGAD